ncbi:hypothetical protein XENOCAPTIV_000541, partial [Xenoophorus captivus]
DADKLDNLEDLNLVLPVLLLDTPSGVCGTVPSGNDLRSTGVRFRQKLKSKAFSPILLHDHMQSVRLHCLKQIT